jgi:CRP-like cAMP-binding protein
MSVSTERERVAVADELFERNDLLAGLPRAELKLVREHAEFVELPVGRVLYERGERLREVFFMTEGLTSLLAQTGGGQIGEVGIIGRDGLIGAPAVLLGDVAMPWVTLVQTAGAALRLPSPGLRDMLKHAPVLTERCFRYIETLMFQVSQVAACNARHGLPERLARWLLMSVDRIGGDTVPLTHEFLANMLGVRRAGVTVTANALQADKLIRVARGRIVIADRAGLEGVCCACYGFVRDHEDQNRARGRLEATKA